MGLWEEEKKDCSVHDKMFGLGEVQVLIIVPRDMSRKILWTMHIDHTCMHAAAVQQQHKAGFAMLSQQQGLQPCTDAMERHITGEPTNQLKTAKPNKGPAGPLLCVSVSPLSVLFSTFLCL